ncbi:MAG: GspH/FimT family pseudopilin [Pseudomonadota bacterium]
MKRASHPGGFTMIELLVTIAIAAILLGLAVPSFMDFLRNTRLTTQANDLVLAFAYAKSEAVKRGVRVTVCSRQNDTTCAGSATWDTGYLVFVDRDGQGDFEPDEDANQNCNLDTGEDANGNGVLDADCILQVRAGLEGGNTMRASGGLQEAVFLSTGYTSGDAATFTFCDVRGASNAEAVILSLQGRARSATDGADADSIVEDGSGNNVTCP